MSPAASGASRRLFIAGVLSGLATVPTVAAEPAALRIVSLGGAVTEILYDLRVGDRIVALDTTSQYPPEALKTKPNVGYLRQLSAEGVLSSRPTLVIAVEGAGPPAALALVREAGLEIVTVPEDTSEAGVERRIMTVATAIGREEEGRKLARETARRFGLLSERRSRVTKPLGALFILSLQNGRVMVGGRNTTADGMLALAGARNVAAAIEGYKPITEEAVIAAMPDVVVMMDNGHGGRSPDDVFVMPGLSQTPAAKSKRLVTMNGHYLLGFGPRTPDAARDLFEAFYPGTASE